MIPISAPLCDHFGRKPALLGSAALLLVAVALQTAAQNTGMFIAARCLIGVGLGINITAAPLLVMELAYPSQRAPMVSLYNALWGLGALAAAWIIYGTFRLDNTWAWRIPSILQELSSICQILLFVIEESPRWLISQERDQEAEKLLVKYHANGDPSNLLVKQEMVEIRTALRLEAEAERDVNWLSFLQDCG